MAAASIAPITALHHSNGLLLVGSANIIRVYTAATGALISTTTVLPAGESVHGIRIIAHNFLLVFGVREVRCHRLDEQHNIAIQPSFARRSPRRVLCLHFECVGGRELLGIGTDENAIRWVTLDASAADGVVACSDAPLLYAMALQRVGSRRFLSIGGSAFRDVIAWDATPSSSASSSKVVRPPLCRLVGHEGAVFRVVPSPCGSWLATVSDDRRVLLWATPTIESSADDDDDQVERMQRTCTEPVSEVRSVAAWFAHGARVWDAAFIVGGVGDTTAAATGDTTSKPLLLASSGEDCLVKLWRVALATAGRQEAEVTLLSTLRGHSGKHVWCVTSIGANGVASGGADGAVKLWPLPQSAVAEPTTITAAAASGSSSAAVPASMVQLPPEEPGAIRALDILETVGCAFAATASGSVWALPLGDEQPPQRLYKEDGNRWSVVHATILDGDSNMKKHSNLKHSNMKNVIVLLGSASGDALLLQIEDYGYSGKWTVYPATQWRAHKTCIMQFAWATPYQPQVACNLASADSTGELTTWPPMVSEAYACPPRGTYRPLPASQRITALAFASPSVWLCGGSAGGLALLSCAQYSIGSSDGATAETFIEHAHGSQPVTSILVEDPPPGAAAPVFTCGRNGVVNAHGQSPWFALPAVHAITHG